MVVDPKDNAVSKFIREKGRYDVAQMRFIKGVLKAGDNVINLGSQTGLEAIYMGKLIGPSGKLFIFEPYSVSFTIVRKNMFLNNLE